MSSKKVCNDFIKGHCKFGPKCKYLHERQVCNHFLSGTCRYGDSCVKSHVSESKQKKPIVKGTEVEIKCDLLLKQGNEEQKETVKIKTHTNISIEEIKEEIKKNYKSVYGGVEDIILQYMDEDGDFISLPDTKQLQDLLKRDKLPRFIAKLKSMVQKNTNSNSKKSSSSSSSTSSSSSSYIQDDRKEVNLNSFSRYLDELSKRKEIDDVISGLVSSRDLKVLLQKETPFPKEIGWKVIKILTKEDMSYATTKISLTNLYHNLVQSSFFTHIGSFSSWIRDIENPQFDITKIKAVVKFSEEILDRVPKMGKLIPIHLFEDILRKSTPDVISATHLKDLIDRFKETYIEVNQSEEKFNFFDYRNSNIIPTPEELLEKPKLPPPMKHFKSGFDYLSMQFHLLKEDCLRPLRECVQSHINRKNDCNYRMMVYGNMSFKKIVIPRNSPTSFRFQLHFNKKINWSRSKRLIYGTLVCISHDEFRTMYFARVAGRPEKPGDNFIDLFLENVPDFDFGAIYKMIECTDAYFEPYYHVMKAIQKINPGDIPFGKYFVDSQKEIPYPNYYNTINSIDLSNIFDSKAKAFPKLDIWPFMSDNLDESQEKAIKNMISKELSLIQGPPGTGKTYVGLQMMKVLLKNKEIISPDSPYLVVTYTNHALDQFLEEILKIDDSLVRVGSRSNSEILSSKNIKKAPIRFRPSDISIIESRINEICSSQTYSYAQLSQFMSPNHIEQFQKISDLNSLTPQEALKAWVQGAIFEENDHNKPINLYREDGDKEEIGLENYDEGDEEANVNRNELEDVKVEEEEDEEENNFMEGDTELPEVPEEETQEEKETLDFEMAQNGPDVDDTADIIKMGVKTRQSLLQKWISKATSDKRIRLFELIKERNEMIEYNESQVIRCQANYANSHKVIGMTTTSAAKFSSLIQMIKPKVVIIEEAAEVLESHILISLSRYTEHLIMIGDHQQLRPSNSVFQLTKKYKFDVSFFERMVKNGAEHVTLLEQRRMHPSISALIKPIYPTLQNHDTVESRDHPLGIKKRVFFLDHRELENSEKNVESMSKLNYHETDFIVKLAEYILRQGYREEQITVLSFYLGQTFKIKDSLTSKGLKGVKVSTVDKYQGLENDIVILSIVRSNKKKSIGYCSIPNRICVALSRAKCGFYLIGNSQTLSEASQDYLEKGNVEKSIWLDILNIFDRNGNIGKSLELVCQNHAENKTYVSKAKDFENCKDGGCKLECNQRLPCGHSCLRLCHPDDHIDKCYQTCNKILDCGHNCKKKCFENCGICREEVFIEISCGHVNKKFCFEDPNSIICSHPCEKKLACGHNCKRTCGRSCGSCSELVMKNFPCGHKGLFKCSEKPSLSDCKEACGKMLDCGHTCPGKCGNCWIVHEQCKHKCERPLPCSHICQVPCSKNCGRCQSICIKRCSHSICSLKCGDPCASCKHNCTWACEHYKCNKLCGEICDRPKCDHPCKIKQKCGHDCMGMCGEPCPPLCRICKPKHHDFEIFFGTEDDQDARFITLPCEHNFEVSSLDKYMEIDKAQPIQMKSCPKCKTLINLFSKRRNPFSQRYTVEINELVLQLEEIKKKIASSQKIEYSSTLNELEKILKHVSFSDKTLDQSFKNYLKNVVEHMRNYINAINRKSKSKPKIKLDYFFHANCVVNGIGEKLLKDAYLIHNSSSNYEEDCHLEKLISKIFNTETNQVQMLEIHMKIKLYFIKHKLENSAGNHNSEIRTQIEELIGEINNHLNQSTTGNKLNEWIEKVEEKLKNMSLELSFEEKKKILLALNMGSGRHFRCPNGHYYVIGECGGATETSRCPDCNEAIGGAQHRLLETNQHASEIDGSSGPAYPGNLDEQFVRFLNEQH